MSFQPWNQHEAVEQIGEVMDRLSKIWPADLEPSDQWINSLNGICQRKDAKALQSALARWEQSETKRVADHRQRQQVRFQTPEDPALPEANPEDTDSQRRKRFEDLCAVAECRRLFGSDDQQILQEVFDGDQAEFDRWRAMETSEAQQAA